MGPCPRGRPAAKRLALDLGVARYPGLVSSTAASNAGVVGTGRDAGLERLTLELGRPPAKRRPAASGALLAAGRRERGAHAGFLDACA